jgi:pilus assembly protein CpaF
MPLLARLFKDASRPEHVPLRPIEPVSEPKPAAAQQHAYQELKARVHNQLFEHIDLARVGEVSGERVSGDIALITRRILAEEKVPLTREEREQVVEEIQHEVFGLGPLEPLLRDPTLSDILVNRYDQVFVERGGRLEKAVTRFKDDAHLMRIIEKITSSVGRRIDELTPYVDARLPDGSRVNAIIPPVALDGPKLSIRRFSIERLTHLDLVRMGTLTEEAMELLAAIARGRLNVLISGGTGTGKTTLLNVMSAFVPPTERIVTIEDSAELQLQQEHVVRLETRPANVEGRGAVTQRELVINTLRMRPDRIIVGEVRGAEALDMLQAMNTGHDGSLTTVHANSPRDAISRLEAMVAMSGLEMPQRVVRQQIGSAIDVVAHVVRLSDGSRRLESLVEITGMEGDVISMSEIYRLERRGLDEKGGVLATLEPTGIRPQFAEKLSLCGIELDDALFHGRGRRG